MLDACATYFGAVEGKNPKLFHCTHVKGAQFHPPAAELNAVGFRLIATDAATPGMIR